MNLIVVTVCAALFDLAIGVQQLRRQTSYSEVNPGGETVLDCIIENKGGNCVWQKDRRVVGIYKGKYEWAGDSDSGDCSLRILSARADIDDGLWECQVTATSFDLFDTVNSDPIPVVVRVPPDPPVLSYEGNPVSEGITVNAGIPQTFTCTSANGNPAPKLRWFLGEKELDKSSNQTDFRQGKRWSSSVTLLYSFQKEDNKKALRCETSHPALEKDGVATELNLNVQYPPTVTLENTPTSDLEEGFDNLFLLCKVDANPPGAVIWRKSGNPDIISTGEKLDFYPLLRKNSGTYTCEAKNSVGVSEIVAAEIDVKYSPAEVTIGAPLSGLIGGTVRLECSADSNPSSEFQFFQKINSIPETSVLRGEGDYLIISNLTYSDQGEYYCSAKNVINGNARTAKSQTRNLRITGPPQFSYGQTSTRIIFNRNSNAVIQIEFCSDPKPNKFVWKSDGIILEPGEVFYDGKFVAEPLRQVRNSSCYEARLIIQRIELSDANTYEITVENDKGTAVGAVLVHVREPVSMTAIIGVVAGCLIFLILVTLCLLYAFRTDKWCFHDEDPEKNDSDINKDVAVKLRNEYVDGMPRATPPKPKVAPNLRYSDLMLPRSSNNGSMRAKKGQYALGLPSVTPIPSPHTRSPSRISEEKLTAM